MPGMVMDQSCLVDSIEKVWNGPFCDFFYSIGILSLLIQVREPLTPDFLHFITCVVEEEAHFLWIMMFWLMYKCSLELDSNLLLSDSQKVTERLKIVVRGLIEIVVALIITGEFKLYSWIYCMFIYTLAGIRSIYKEKFDIFATFFITCYCL